MRNFSLAAIVLTGLFGLLMLAGAFIAGAAFWKVNGRSIEENYGPKRAPAVSHDRLVHALRSENDVEMEKDFRKHPFMIPDEAKASRIIVDVLDRDHKPIAGNIVEFVVTDLRRISYQTQTDSNGLAWAKVMKGLKTIVVVIPPEGLTAQPSAIHEIVPDKDNVHIHVMMAPELSVSKGTLEMREYLKDPATRADLNAKIEKQAPRAVWVHQHGAPAEFCIVHADSRCPNLLNIQKEHPDWIVKKRQLKSDEDGKYLLLLEDDGSPLEEYGAPIHCDCARN